MIADALKFLLDRLNESVNRQLIDEVADPLFVYVGTNKEDSLSFKPKAVSVLLVRVEEEATLRQPDPYSRMSATGGRQKVAPEIRMNLWVLFVARFPDDYHRALQHISDVIHYFQNHRVFDRENSPDLKEEVAPLVLELVTPSFSEQNEIWGALRTAYQPSVLYKVKMLVFRDEDGQPLKAVEELTQTVVQVSSS